MTEIFRATLDGDVSRLRKAIRNGAGVNEKDKCGNTPLSFAAETRSPRREKNL